MVCYVISFGPIRSLVLAMGQKLETGLTHFQHCAMGARSSIRELPVFFFAFIYRGQKEANNGAVDLRLSPNS